MLVGDMTVVWRIVFILIAVVVASELIEIAVVMRRRRGDPT